MALSPTIDLEEVYSAIQNELDDVYTDGIISAAIFNKKTPKRLLLYAINQADIHICLKLKLKSYVFLYAPADLKTIFFDRQAEWVKGRNDEYTSIKTVDNVQYAYLIGNQDYLDVVSCDSEIALAFSDLPENEAATPIGLWNSEANDVHSKLEDYQYQRTTKLVYPIQFSANRFYVDSRRRMIVLAEPFSTPKWILVNAAIAPVRLSLKDISKTDLDDYEIRAPYNARQWLINRAMTHVLPNRAAQEGGYFDMEVKSERETFQTLPSEGNVIIPGDEMSGNYEADFSDF